MIEVQFPKRGLIDDILRYQVSKSQADMNNCGGDKVAEESIRQRPAGVLCKSVVRRGFRCSLDMFVYFHSNADKLYSTHLQSVARTIDSVEGAHSHEHGSHRKQQARRVEPLQTHRRGRSRGAPRRTCANFRSWSKKSDWSSQKGSDLCKQTDQFLR